MEAAADRPQRAYQEAHDSLVAGWNCCQSLLLAMAETLDPLQVFPCLDDAH